MQVLIFLRTHCTSGVAPTVERGVGFIPTSIVAMDRVTSRRENETHQEKSKKRHFPTPKDSKSLEYNSKKPLKMLVIRENNGPFRRVYKVFVKMPRRNKDAKEAKGFRW